MYRLTPIVSKSVESFVNDKKKVAELVNMFDSPLNIIFPQSASQNVHLFEQVFDKARIEGQVYYAHKANKSAAIVRELARTSAAIDVASINELTSAFANGFSADRIQATGPKNNEFIALCITHGVTIAIDDPDELTRIIRLSNTMGDTKTINVLIRLNDFTAANRTIIRKDVRFGISKVQLPALLATIQKNAKLRLKGFSFHLPTTSVSERSVALEATCMEFVKALELGLQPTMISIGGGFSLNYLQSEIQWRTYINALKDSVIHPDNQKMTWNGSGLGFWAEKGTLKGAPKYFEFYTKVNQFKELDQCLNYYSESLGSSLAEFCSANGITVAIEPGRSLVDQAGITIARVQSVRSSLMGEDCVVLDMNRSHINGQDLEYMSDPIHIPLQTHKLEEKEFSCFLMGNLCLPHDLISRRRVYFKTRPKPGDLLVFPNTAGYFMDFNESTVLQHRLAKKVAVKLDGDEQHIYEDEHYPLVDLGEMV